MREGGRVGSRNDGVKNEGGNEVGIMEGGRAGGRDIWREEGRK